ncbi:MAG TPA: glycoside hydrolase family 3 C-terminal domain-containing protein [Thermoleophilaceae bacterium]
MEAGRGRRAALCAWLIAMLFAASPAHAAGRCGDHPWCDTSLSPDARAGLLLDALTQDEKVSLLAGDDLAGGFSGGPTQHTGTSDGVPRVGLPPVYYSDGPVGPRQGSATALPVPMALAATFDPAMAFAHGSVVGNEVKDKGNDVVFAPTVNIMRTPLGGRTFEAYGEDPFLDAQMAVGWIDGAQSQGVIADVKHFAANNQEGDAGPVANLSAPGQPIGPPPVAGNRMTENSVVDERTLREIYLPQFEAAVKDAHVGTVMCSYNRLNGDYACENPHLLHDILERDWGFKGYVIADYGAAHDTPGNLNGGLDFEPWPGLAYSSEAVDAVLAAGLATPQQVDDHVRRVLRTLFAYGFFDRSAYKDDDAQIDKTAHAQTAEQIEQSAITLLENRGALPLRTAGLRSIAVIGKDANAFITGGGSGDVTPFSFVTPLQAIRQRAGSGVRVSYDDGSDASSAAALAKGADVALVFAGDYETEGTDRACLTLECPNTNGDQDSMIEQVAAANPNSVVVLETGGPVLTPWRDKVAGLVEAWYPGEQGGTAIAHVLFGDADPGGRLPATFPREEGDIPTAGDPEKYPGVAENVKYKEGVLVGYRWYDANGIAPAFPFGFGLSYTSFGYSGLRVSGSSASVTVTNTGSRSGVEVPQLYLGLPSPGPGVVQPPKQLKGFEKLSLAPGESRRVTFAITPRDLSYWDTGAGDWRIAPGCYGVMVGRSSRDIVRRATLAVGASCPGAAASMPVPTPPSP